MSFGLAGSLVAGGPGPKKASSGPTDGPLVLAERATTRLSQHLDQARIESPLVELAPAHDLGDLADPALDLLLDETFEEFEWEFSGWPPTPDASVASGDGGRFLRVDSFGDRAPLGWVLPVRPDAFYRFQRSVRVEGAPFCDFYVVESRLEPEDESPDAGDHFLAGRGAALKVHSLPMPALENDGRPSEEWQHGATTFYPTPRTRSLVVLIRPRTGADPGATVSAMHFDDIRLEEVVASRKERMRLMKGAHAGPSADPELGLEKAGWLLPLPSPDGTRSNEPAESNYDWRRAWYVPPTTEIAFDVVVPDAARLLIGTGLARETPPGAAARFQVEVACDGEEPARLLDVVRSARTEDWHWEDAELDLSKWAGREATLVMRTLAEKGDPHPLWANPRVAAGSRSEDPLMILIAVDTLRADRLSAYGYERPTSPALDRLASEGVRFDQARSNCNWTCPSFASIFTGLVPSRHGVSSYGPATPLPDELVTLAEHLQSRGWATRSIAYKVPLFDGNYEQGFDQAFNVPRDVIRGEENLARALEWLEDHRGGPSFLFLHFNDPHQPFVQPEPYDRSFGPAPETLGYRPPFNVPSGSEEEARELFANLYDGAVSYVDSCIGRFLEALRERELYDHASVLFVADHGEQLWEHGRFGHGGDDLYDEIVRVPLIVKPPAGTFEAGQVIEADVSGFDVMPTLLELAGIAPPGEIDALSLMPLIAGERDSFDRVVVTETSQRGLALVDGGYKFVLQPRGAVESLYDLSADPLELEDVAEAQPEELARLRRLAIEYILEHRPGNFLLARCGDEPTELRVGTRLLRTLVGARAEPDRTGGTGASTVRLVPTSWTLLEVEGNDVEAVAVEGIAVRGPESGFEAFEPGTLSALEGPGVWRFHGPRAAQREVEEAEPVDAELLETLRALGYAE